MNKKYRMSLDRIAFVGALMMIGVSLSLTGCDSKKETAASTEEERKSFAADPSKMPPDVRAKMEAARQVGSGKTRPQGDTTPIKP